MREEYCYVAVLFAIWGAWWYASLQRDPEPSWWLLPELKVQA